MGCEKSSITEIWRDYEHQFPVRERFIYLNHAAVAPLCRRAVDAMRQLADDCLLYGALHYDQWCATYEGLRRSAAQLIGASAEEIAILKNTSEGISTVARGIDWKPGDRMVGFVEEFRANYFPWKDLERLGVRVEWLSILDPLERIDEAARGARLLAVSYVNYLSGLRANLQAIGEICRRHDVFFFVDSIQGLGAFPLDVEACGIDALAADGHKWMFGPEGCGILYVRKDRQEFVRPAQIGWSNFARYADYASRDMTFRPNAARYEAGTLNTISCYGLRASIDFLLEVGIARIGAAVQALGDRLAEGAAAKGYELAAVRSRETGAGIVSIRKAGVDARQLVRRLQESNMLATPRLGWVRFSPHFYISLEEIDRVVDLLP